jgi:nanoRNase/pAp phosphatase (c-di-AMP/oligoRNAs hydrolase)
LAVIPGVGAVISAISAAGTTANNLVQACKPLAEKGAAVAQIVDATKDKIEEAKCEAYNLKKKLSGVMGKAGGGGGGKAGGGKARQKKIQRTTRRIRRLLARFTRRVGGKPPQPPF